MKKSFQLPTHWSEFLGPKLKELGLNQLEKFIDQELLFHKKIYPPKNEVFRAFEYFPPAKCKCVILGQDPYHGFGQAHGLAFSVTKNCKIPPSLRNIFKEYAEDLGYEIPQQGDLSAWANEGVLLLNTVLSVEEARPGSHFKKGWELLTDLVIEKLGESPVPMVFILWGAPSQKKRTLIKGSHHLILEAPHPSPLSSYRGFFGSRPFSKVNHFLKEKGLEIINWKI